MSAFHGKTHGLILSRSSLLSNIDTGKVTRYCQTKTLMRPHLIIHRSPLGIDHHELSRQFSTLFCLCDLFLSELLDRPCTVDVRSICSGAKDCSNQGGTALVRSRQKRPYSLHVSLILAKAYIVDQRATADVHVLSIQSVLQQFHNIVPNRVLGIETLCPGQEFARVYGSLFHREADISGCLARRVRKGETEMHWLVGILDSRANVGEECVHRVRNVIYRQ